MHMRKGVHFASVALAIGVALMSAVRVNGGGSMPPVSASSDRIEHIYHAWDNALGKKDVNAAMAPDATIESPLVSYLLNRD